MTQHSQGKYCSEACQRIGWRKGWRDYGDRNREARRAYHREHYIEVRDKVAERVRAYVKTEVGKRVVQKSGATQRKKFPEKYAARQAVGVAVREGTLSKQPCVKCGAKRVHAHHPDYAKPLDVVWLCPACHRLEHQRDAT